MGLEDHAMPSIADTSDFGLQEERALTPHDQSAPAGSIILREIERTPNFTGALPGHTRRRAPVWRPRRGGGHGQRGGGGVPTRYKQAGASARRDGASHAGGGGCIVT